MFSKAWTGTVVFYQVVFSLILLIFQCQGLLTIKEDEYINERKTSPVLNSNSSMKRPSATPPDERDIDVTKDPIISSDPKGAVQGLTEHTKKGSRNFKQNDLANSSVIRIGNKFGKNDTSLKNDEVQKPSHKLRHPLHKENKLNAYKNTIHDKQYSTTTLSSKKTIKQRRKTVNIFSYNLKVSGNTFKLEVKPVQNNIYDAKSKSSKISINNQHKEQHNTNITREEDVEIQSPVQIIAEENNTFDTKNGSRKIYSSTTSRTHQGTGQNIMSTTREEKNNNQTTIHVHLDNKNKKDEINKSHIQSKGNQHGDKFDIRHNSTSKQDGVKQQLTASERDKQNYFSKAYRLKRLERLREKRRKMALAFQFTESKTNPNPRDKISGYFSSSSNKNNEDNNKETNNRIQSITQKNLVLMISHLKTTLPTTNKKSFEHFMSDRTTMNPFLDRKQAHNYLSSFDKTKRPKRWPVRYVLDEHQRNTQIKHNEEQPMTRTYMAKFISEDYISKGIDAHAEQGNNRSILNVSDGGSLGNESQSVKIKAKTGKAIKAKKRKKRNKKKKKRGKSRSKRNKRRRKKNKKSRKRRKNKNKKSRTRSKENRNRKKHKNKRNRKNRNSKKRNKKSSRKRLKLKHRKTTVSPFITPHPPSWSKNPVVNTNLKIKDTTPNYTNSSIKLNSNNMNESDPAILMPKTETTTEINNMTIMIQDENSAQPLRTEQQHNTTFTNYDTENITDYLIQISNKSQDLNKTFSNINNTLTSTPFQNTTIVYNNSQNENVTTRSYPYIDLENITATHKSIHTTDLSVTPLEDEMFTKPAKPLALDRPTSSTLRANPISLLKIDGNAKASVHPTANTIAAEIKPTSMGGKASAHTTENAVTAGIKPTSINDNASTHTTTNYTNIITAEIKPTSIGDINETMSQKGHNSSTASPKINVLQSKPSLKVSINLEHSLIASVKPISYKLENTIDNFTISNNTFTEKRNESGIITSSKVLPSVVVSTKTNYNIQHSVKESVSQSNSSTDDVGVNHNTTPLTSITSGSIPLALENDGWKRWVKRKSQLFRKKGNKNRSQNSTKKIKQRNRSKYSNQRSGSMADLMTRKRDEDNNISQPSKVTTTRSPFVTYKTAYDFLSGYRGIRRPAGNENVRESQELNSAMAKRMCKVFNKKFVPSGIGGRCV